MNTHFPVRYNTQNWASKYDSQIDPYNQLLFSEYPDMVDPGFNLTGQGEFIQDNVYIGPDGKMYVRDETEYELQNVIIHPANTGITNRLNSANGNHAHGYTGLTITPKRLARDPGGVIQRFQLGWLKNPSDEYTSLVHRGQWSKLVNRRKKKRD